MLLRVVKTLGSMGVELLNKVVLHLVHRWNIKAGIKNCDEPDLGHASFSRLRELLRMAEKLGIQASILDIRLPPADYNPPELFGAMWQPDYLTPSSAPAASDGAPLPTAADLEIADEDPIGLEDLLEGSLSDLLEIDGPVEEFIAANAGKTASHWKKLTNVETPAEKELFASFVGKMADSSSSTDGIDYSTMQDWWATKVNVEGEKDPDMQIHPKSAHILKLYGEALMMERVFASNMEAISPASRAAAEMSLRNMTAPQPFRRIQPAPSKKTRGHAITTIAAAEMDQQTTLQQQQQQQEEEEEEAAPNDMMNRHEEAEGSMADEDSQPPGTGYHGEQEQEHQQQQAPSAGPTSQPGPAVRHPPSTLSRQSQQQPSSAGPSQPDPTVQNPPAAPRQSLQLPSSAGPSQREPAVQHSLAAFKQPQQLPLSAGPSQPEPVHRPPSATHMPQQQPFHGMHPPPLHAPPGVGQPWYPHHYSALPAFHPGYPAIPMMMAYHPYPPQAHPPGMMFHHHHQAVSGAVPAGNAGTLAYAPEALPSRNPPAGARATGRGGAGTPKTCQTCFEKEGKRIPKKNHDCPHNK